MFTDYFERFIWTQSMVESSSSSQFTLSLDNLFFDRPVVNKVWENGHISDVPEIKVGVLTVALMFHFQNKHFSWLILYLSSVCPIKHNGHQNHVPANPPPWRLQPSTCPPDRPVIALKGFLFIKMCVRFWLEMLEGWRVDLHLEVFKARMLLLQSLDWCRLT